MYNAINHEIDCIYIDTQMKSLKVAAFRDFICVDIKNVGDGEIYQLNVLADKLTSHLRRPFFVFKYSAKSPTPIFCENFINILIFVIQ